MVTIGQIAMYTRTHSHTAQNRTFQNYTAFITECALPRINFCTFSSTIQKCCIPLRHWLQWLQWPHTPPHTHASVGCHHNFAIWRASFHSGTAGPLAWSGHSRRPTGTKTNTQFMRSKRALDRRWQLEFGESEQETCSIDDWLMRMK